MLHRQLSPFAANGKTYEIKIGFKSSADEERKNRIDLNFHKKIYLCITFNNVQTTDITMMMMTS
jgi:hypothetical protein